MIRQADVEAERNIRNINIAGIAVIVAVSNAEGELTFSQRLAIVDGEQPRRSAFRSSRANRRRIISGIILGILGRRSSRQNKNGERAKQHSVRESHRVPPGIWNERFMRPSQ